LFLILFSFLYLSIPKFKGQPNTTSRDQKTSNIPGVSIVPIFSFFAADIMHYDYRMREQIDITSDVAAYIGDESLLPEITLLSDSVAQLRYSYWGRWRGLVRVMIRIAKENGTTTFTHISDETLVEYDCGWVV
jgi:hypothetical protein